MYEASHFRQMQDDYFQSYSKQLNVQSSQVLFTSFHPLYGEGDYILMLELIVNTDTTKLLKMDIPQQLKDYHTSYNRFASTLIPTTDKDMNSRSKRDSERSKGEVQPAA